MSGEWACGYVLEFADGDTRTAVARTGTEDEVAATAWRLEAALATLFREGSTSFHGTQVVNAVVFQCRADQVPES